MTVRRIGIVAKHGLAAAASHLAGVTAWLHERGIETIVETETATLADLRQEATLSREAIVRTVDLLLVLGGDGTLLSVAGHVGAARVSTPILGVNFGRLGFLTEVTLQELYPALEAVLAGEARVQNRRLLRCEALREGRAYAEYRVLNDAVVTKGAISRVVYLTVTVDGQFMTNVKADGVIVATPTGSTAYNLAAAGPIIHPDVDAIVITPIAPHTLANRPIVIPGDSTVEISPLADSRQMEVFATFDGQTGLQLEPEDVVRVSCAKELLRLIGSPTRAYYDTLREKLGWGDE
jgi:NAD+ kinase